MFIGHFGLGLATKKAAPKISLGTLLMATQFLDLVWPTLLLLHIETVAIHPGLSGPRSLEFTNYPITHSLLGAIGWSVLFGSIYWIFKKNSKNGILLGLAVLSHWFLDLIVHFHDLPLYPGSSIYLGLGAWASIWFTTLIEMALLITGIILYLQTITFKNMTGKIVFALLIILLLLVQISNFWGPPPANVQALAWSAQFQWLFVAMAYWADNNTVNSQVPKYVLQPQ